MRLRNPAVVWLWQAHDTECEMMEEQRQDVRQFWEAMDAARPTVQAICFMVESRRHRAVAARTMSAARMSPCFGAWTDSSDASLGPSW